MVHLYGAYRLIKKWLAAKFAPAKNKFIFPLLSRSTLHIVIIFLAIAVIFNNFFIREIKAEDIGKSTLLSSLVTNDLGEEEIIEKTPATLTGKINNYQQINGIVSSATIPANASQSNENGDGQQIITSLSSAAVLKPGISSTEVGNRPREEVIYYIVEGGDTVSTIAEKFNLTTNSILWENKLGPRDYIKPGDKLTILPLSGVSYQIKSGDTLDKIASRYKASTDEIIAFNNLVDSTDIEKDQIIIVPSGVMPEEPKPKPAIGSLGAFASNNIPPSARASGAARLQWPTTGNRINQYFNWRHSGIDIDGEYSSPIYAAEDGRVETTGWGGGYGNQIIINHGGGLKTHYSHLSKIFVRVGDSVSRGQTIGMMGSTGRSTGTHLDFEVIINGVKVNPLGYL